MSYDLFLDVEDLGISRDQFLSFFKDRPWYSLSKKQAFYENTDTGVNFHFEYSNGEVYPLAFHLNYFRPHFFALEAVKEVGALIKHFDCSLLDPQQNGMKEGPFSEAGFLRGWNTGNRMGVKTILASKERPQTYVCPTHELERVWRWNYQRKALQAKLGDSVFVPKIMFMKANQSAQTTLIWPDGCPIAMPQVDVILMMRERLAPETCTINGREITLVDWQKIEPELREYPIATEGFHLLKYMEPTTQLADFIRSLPFVPHKQELALENDDVLNSELV